MSRLDYSDAKITATLSTLRVTRNLGGFSLSQLKTNLIIKNINVTLAVKKIYKIN